MAISFLQTVMKVLYITDVCKMLELCFRYVNTAKIVDSYNNFEKSYIFQKYSNISILHLNFSLNCGII